MVWYSHLFQNFPQFIVYIRLVYIFVLYIYILVLYMCTYIDSILVWLPNKFISLIIVNDLCKLIFKEYSFKLLLRIHQ